MGHGTGDELLVAVADRLTATLPLDDTVARLGGDEFAILIEGAAHADEIEEIAARIVDALSLRSTSGSGLATSVSVGVATTPGARGAAEMLCQADLALYAAKGAGKGRGAATSRACTWPRSIGSRCGPSWSGRSPWARSPCCTSRSSISAVA